MPHARHSAAGNTCSAIPHASPHPAPISGCVREARQQQSCLPNTAQPRSKESEAQLAPCRRHLHTAVQHDSLSRAGLDTSARDVIRLQIRCSEDTGSALQPVRRLGPMQAAKLAAMASRGVQGVAIQSIPRKRNSSSSQAKQPAGGAPKRHKAAATEGTGPSESPHCAAEPLLKRSYVADTVALQQPLKAAAPESACTVSAGSMPCSVARHKPAPGAVCAKCEQRISSAAADCTTSWACAGPCRQSFHSACAPLTAMQRCIECTGSMRVCFFCKQLTAAARLTKCSVASCGRFYHAQCAARQACVKLSSHVIEHMTMHVGPPPPQTVSLTISHDQAMKTQSWPRDGFFGAAAHVGDFQIH